MSYSGRFQRDPDEKQELITRFPVALKRSRSSQMPMESEPEWLKVMVERISDVGVELENVKTVRTQQKVQLINVLYRIFALGDNYLWRIILLVSIVLNFIQVSYAYIFLRDASNRSAYFSILICDTLYLIDYTLALAAYFWKNLQIRLVNPPRSKNTLIYDSFLVLPYSLIYEAIYKDDGSWVFIALRSISFFRLFHLVRFFKEKSNRAGVNHWKYFIIEYFIYFFLLQHALACIWYLMALPLGSEEPGGWTVNINKLNRYPKTYLQWYILCMYFALINITNSGLGDLVPTNGPEELIATLTMALGFTLTIGVFIGSLTSQFVNSSLRKALMRNQIIAITTHCKMIGFSKKKIDQVMGYYFTLWTKKKGVREAEDIKLLPQPLLMEICFDVNFGLLQCSLIFRDKPESFLRTVSLKMKHEFYQVGDIIYHQNVMKYKMVCVASGVIEILSDEDNQSPIISFTAGTCIGEAALILSLPARATIRAACYTEVQVLYKNDFLKIIESFPEFFASIRKQILERVNDAMQQRSNDTDKTKEVVALSLYISHSRQLSEIKKLKDRVNPKIAYTFDSTDTFYRKCLPLYRFSENIRKMKRKPLCLSENFPWIIQPETTISWTWEIYIVINTFLIGILYPFYIAFYRAFPPWLDTLSIFLELNNVIDVYMILTTAIVEKDHTIHTFKEILFKRLNTFGFYLDVFSAYYIELFSFVMTEKMHWYYILKLNRMLKMHCIVKFFTHLEQSLTTKLFVVRLIKYPIYLIMCPYWFGAILYFETCFNEVCDPTGWFQTKLIQELSEHSNHSCTQNPVLVSVYYGLTCLSGLGYGDIPPGNYNDVIFVGLGVLIGIFIFGYCTAEFSATFTHNLKKKIDFQEALYGLQNFMITNHMNDKIKKEVSNFFVLQWYYNEGIEITSKQTLFYNATWKIQQDVLVKERMETILNVPLFSHADLDFLQLIAIRSRVIVLPPKAMVTYAGGLSREMYIIQNGYCEQLTGRQQQQQVLGPLSHFGAEGLLYAVQNLTSVRTITHVKLISIDATNFTKAISMFPVIGKEIKQIGDNLDILEQLKDLTKNVKIHADYKYSDRQKLKGRFTCFGKHSKGSFLNVYLYCQTNKESYGKPFKNLGNFFWLKYFLLPICILPDGVFIKAWMAIRLLTICFICLLTPYQFIQSPYIPLLDKILFGLDFFAYADLYIMMLVGYYGSKQQLIIHPYKTAAHYMKGLFTVDLIFCFPWEILVKLLMPQHNEGHSIFSHSLSPHTYHCLFRSLRIFQAYRLPRAFQYLEQDIKKKGDILQILKFVPFTLMFINIWACIVIVTSCKYFHISDIYNIINPNGTAKPPGMAEQKVDEYTMFCLENCWIDRSRYHKYTKPSNIYITAIYWCSSTLMGTGFGDITPQDKMHLFINMQMIIFGVLFFGYVYASISSHKAGLHSTLSTHQEMLKELKEFMEYENAPTIMQKNIVEYNEYLWKRTGGTEPNIILANVHTALLEDAVLYMYEDTLREVPLFENVERSFFRIIGKELRERYFTKGQTVLRANDVINSVNIIYRGKVEVISSYNEMQTFMGVGGLFGNVTPQSKAKCSVTITAVRNLDVLFLKTEAFYSILKRYPSIMKKIENILKNENYEYYIMPTTLFTSENESDKFNYEGKESMKPTFAEDNTQEILTLRSGSATAATTVTGSESIMAFFLPHKWGKIAILPDASIFVAFNYITIIAAYVNALITTYQFAFQHYNVQLFIIIVLFDVIFLLKVFLEFHKAYIDRYGEYVTDNRKIRYQYFKNKKRRAIDFISTIPIWYCSFFFPLFSPFDPYLIFSISRLITLLRCYYIMEFYKDQCNKLMANTLFLKISTIIMWIALITHVFACIWYILACPIIYCEKKSWLTRTTEYDVNDKLSLYITCFYVIMNVLTTTGTGDIVPSNRRELIYITSTMFVTKFFIAMFIGDVTSVLNSYTSSLVNYEYGIAELRDYLHNENVSDHQMEKMWHYVKQLWTRSRGKQIPRLLSRLPYVMRYDLMNEVYGHHLRQSYVFSGTEEAFIRQLSLKLNHVIFFPGNYIVQHGDSNQTMYFIHRGEVDILTVHSNLTETIHEVLHAGEMFGIAQGLYHGVPHHFSFRAKTTVDIITLRLNTWQDLLKFFPDSQDLIYSKAELVYMQH